MFKAPIQKVKAIVDSSRAVSKLEIWKEVEEGTGHVYIRYNFILNGKPEIPKVKMMSELITLFNQALEDCYPETIVKHTDGLCPLNTLESVGPGQ